MHLKWTNESDHSKLSEGKGVDGKAVKGADL